MQSVYKYTIYELPGMHAHSLPMQGPCTTCLTLWLSTLTGYDNRFQHQYLASLESGTSTNTSGCPDQDRANVIRQKLGFTPIGLHYCGDAGLGNLLTHLPVGGFYVMLVSVVWGLLRLKQVCGVVGPALLRSSPIA